MPPYLFFAPKTALPQRNCHSSSLVLLELFVSLLAVFMADKGLRVYMYVCVSARELAEEKKSTPVAESPAG